MRAKAVALLVPVLFALALTTPGAGREGFLHEDEWRNAVMTREMAETGPALFPRLHGGLYPDYPPLYFWTAIPIVKLEGRLTPLAVRFPSVLGAALLALGTALLALRLGSARTALAAGVLVSVLPALLFEERRAMIDPLFAGLACMATALLARASPRTFLAGSFFLALTWLTKGPLGAVVVGLALAGGEGLLVASERDTAELRRGALRAALLLALVLALAAAWFGAAYHLEGKAFGENLLVRQTYGRFAHGVIKQHQKPFVYYFGSTLPALLPVAAFALFARRSRLTVFAVGWFALVFLFFSISNTKRSYYPMPCYPAVAILAASFFEGEETLPEWTRLLWQRAVAWPLAAAVPLGALVGFYDKELLPYGLAVSLGALLAHVVFRLLVARRKPALALAAACGLVLAAVFASAIPAFARKHGQKDLAASLAGVEHFAVSPGGIHREALCFFFGEPHGGTTNIESKTDRPDVPGIKRWLAQFPPGKAGVIVQRRDVEGPLQPFGDPTLVPLAASDDETSSEAYVVIGRRR